MRRAFAILLIVVGAVWTVMSVVGTMMMSRSVGMVTEALLPGVIGVAIALAGVYLWSRPSRG